MRLTFWYHRGMEKLLTYLNGLDTVAQRQFAQRCETSVGYLRKACSTGQRLGEGMCIKIERESQRTVLCEHLRPDVDWAFIRNSAPRHDLGQHGVGEGEDTIKAAGPLPALDHAAETPAWDGVDRRDFLKTSDLPADLERRQQGVGVTGQGV